jgi:hypothetical protein
LRLAKLSNEFLLPNGMIAEMKTFATLTVKQSLNLILTCPGIFGPFAT